MKKMTILEIKKNLCHYDKENPDCTGIDDNFFKIPCSCDNCVSGRTPLARYILNSLEIPKLTDEEIVFYNELDGLLNADI